MISKCKKTIKRIFNDPYFWMSLSIGSLLSAFSYIKLQTEMSKIYNVLINRHQLLNKITKTTIILSGVMLLLFVCFAFMVLLSYAALNNDKNKGFLYGSISIILIMFDVMFFSVNIVRKKMDIYLVVLVFISITWIIWCSIKLFKILYQWIQINGDKKFDLAKLTFIWTIIAALFGWFLHK